MHLYRALIALCLICSCAGLALSQTADKPGRISGRITDEHNKPVEYATVVLLRPDSGLVNGTLTDENGNFQIGQQDTGVFLLRVSGIGFTTRTLEIGVAPGERKSIPVTVKSAAAVMKEVEVRGERHMMELALDKKVFNVEKNITSAGGNAADVLQNVPSVSVDADGSVSLRRKNNVTILIDGKPAALLGGDLATILQSMPASGIESIEVITNPSARYDAQGVGGIINIVTKKDRRFGRNGSATLGARTENKYNAGINLNAKNHKWNLFLNSSARSHPIYSYITTDRINRDGARFSTFENSHPEFISWFSTIGSEYNINGQSTLTLTQNLGYVNWRENGVITYRVFGSDGHLTSIQRRSFEQEGRPVSSTTSLDYKHLFARPGQELTSNITYGQTRDMFNEAYRTNSFDSTDTALPNIKFQQAPARRVNQSLNVQADMAIPFLSKNGKLDAGLKSQLFRFYCDNDPVIDTGTGPQTDVMRLNNYNYIQHVHAAYLGFSDQLGNWTYNAGLRLEYAAYDGSSSALNGSTYTSDYSGLFPSAFMSYKFPKDQMLNLSYTRRTNRPDFNKLMPYVNITSPQNLSRGNPSLLPEFIHNTELGYSRQIKGGHSLMGSIYYQYTQNLIEWYRTFYADGTRLSQPQNLNSGITYGLELIGRAQIRSACDVTASVNYFRNEVSGTNIDPALSNTGYSWFGKINMNLRLPADFSVQLNGNYRAPKVVSQGRALEMGWLDAGVRKNFLKNRATVVLSISDILNSRKLTEVYDLQSLTQSVGYDRETRIGTITFTYRFGNSDNQSGSRRARNNMAPQKDRDHLKVNEGD